MKKKGVFDQNPAAQSLTARRESEPRRTKCERKEGANRLGASSEWANEALATTLETVLCRFWVGTTLGCASASLAGPGDVSGGSASAVNKGL